MEILIFVCVMVLIIYFGKKRSHDDYYPRSTQNSIYGNESSKNIESIRVPAYKKKYSVMSPSESAFLFELKKQLPSEYYIFPKMRIADMVYPIHGKGFYGRRNEVLPKHVDFLICNKNFEPKIAVEINDKSHLRQDRIERDERVKQIFEDAKIPLEFINVGSSFATEVSKIMPYCK